MKAKELISFLGKSIDDTLFLEFLETNNFDISKMPRNERNRSPKSKHTDSISKLHGIELCFCFENSVLELYEIIFFKPKSDGFQAIYEIEYPFGLHLHQKIADYEKIFDNSAGFIEPQSRNYYYKNYAITIFFESTDLDKKIISFEISIKQNEN